MTIKFTWKNECPIHKPTKCKSEESDDGLSDAIQIQNHRLKKKEIVYDPDIEISELMKTKEV